MTLAPAAHDAPPLMIAGHSVASVVQAGGMLSLRIALREGSFVELARAMARLDGVRVTSGPEGVGGDRCCIAHCPGFKVVVSAPRAEEAGFALALVSRTPQAALSVMSDLGVELERLMSAAARPPDPVPVAPPTSRRRAPLAQGKPLARKTELRRRTPLARGRFR
jgi:hypothetical protein